MSGEHFTLTISQSTTDDGDFAIHFNEQGKQREKVLVQVQFVDKNIFDENFMDEVVGIVARKLARKIIDQKGRLKPVKSKAACEREAKKIVKSVLEKMRKQS